MTRRGLLRLIPFAAVAPAALVAARPRVIKTATLIGPPKIQGLGAWVPKGETAPYFGLARTPAGRLADVMYLWNAGVISRDHVAAMLEGARA